MRILLFALVPAFTASAVVRAEAALADMVAVMPFEQSAAPAGGAWWVRGTRAADVPLNLDDGFDVQPATVVSDGQTVLAIRVPEAAVGTTYTLSGLADGPRSLEVIDGDAPPATPPSAPQISVLVSLERNAPWAPAYEVATVNVDDDLAGRLIDVYVTNDASPPTGVGNGAQDPDVIMTFIEEAGEPVVPVRVMTAERHGFELGGSFVHVRLRNRATGEMGLFSTAPLQGSVEGCSAAGVFGAPALLLGLLAFRRRR